MSKKINNHEKLHLLADRIELELRNDNQANITYNKDLSLNIASSVIQMENHPVDNNIRKYNNIILAVAEQHPNKITNIAKIINKNYSGPNNKKMRDLINSAFFIAKENALIKDRINKLKNINPDIKPNNKNFIDPQNASLEQTLIDRLPGKLKDYPQVAIKNTGLSTGYVAQDKNKNQYMMKPIKTNNKHTNPLLEEREKRDNINEIMASALAEKLLYDKTPKEKIISDLQNTKNIYIGSKFLENAIPLDNFKKILGGYSGKKKHSFEKIVVASNFLNDFDYHEQNIMLNSKKENKLNEQGIVNEETGFILKRIDYGKAFYIQPENFGQIIKEIYIGIDTNDYKSAISKKDLTFNINECSNSLNQMLDNISDPQYTDNIIDQKIAELKQSGFDPKGLKLFRGNRYKYEMIKINNFDELGDFYKNRIRENVVIYKEAAKDFEIIGKFDKDQKFKNGGWLEEMVISGQDPLQYAIENNIKMVDVNPNTGNIEKYEARDWAKMKGYELDQTGARVKSPTVTLPAIKHNNWVKNADGKWETVDPDYLNNVKPEIRPNPATKPSFIRADSNPEIITNQLSNLIDNYSKQAKDGRIKPKQVKEFHDKSLVIFKEGGYLSDTDITKIKNSNNYADSINKMNESLKTSITTSELKSKFWKGIANVSKFIGLQTISNAIENRMSIKTYEYPNLNQAIIDSISVNQKFIDKNKQVSVENKRDFTQEAKTKINNQQNNR